MKIHRGDSVIVICGNDAGPTPHRVVQILDGDKVMIEGVNRVLKHVRRGHPRSPQGGRLTLEKPIHISNVKYYCHGCSKASRIGYRYTLDGRKERFCKNCGASAGAVSPPRAKYAKQ
jgi:large subunit ribosomal protein L24